MTAAHTRLRRMRRAAAPLLVSVLLVAVAGTHSSGRKHAELTRQAYLAITGLVEETAGDEGFRVLSVEPGPGQLRFEVQLRAADGSFQRHEIRLREWDPHEDATVLARWFSLEDPERTPRPAFFALGRLLTESLDSDPWRRIAPRGRRHKLTGPGHALLSVLLYLVLAGLVVRELVAAPAAPPCSSGDGSPSAAPPHNS